MRRLSLSPLRPHRALVAALAGSFIVASIVACGGGGGSSTATPSGTAGAKTSPTAGDGNAGPTCGPAGSAIAAITRNNTRRFDAAPKRVIDPAKKYTVSMRTSRGVITLDLDAANAPITTNNFVFLSCDGFYDGLTFHRVVKGPPPFVIQGGDPRGDGTGGPGYIFDNEISPKIKHDSAGVISMANSGPNTNGSQFFITLAPQPVLDGAYNAFGHVTDGQSVVDSIAVGDKIISISVQEQ